MADHLWMHAGYNTDCSQVSNADEPLHCSVIVGKNWGEERLRLGALLKGTSVVI